MIKPELVSHSLDRNLLFQKENHDKLVLDDKEGWCNSDAFYPFEPMRIAIQNIMETIASLGYGNAPGTTTCWNYLNAAKDDIGLKSFTGRKKETTCWKQE